MRYKNNPFNIRYNEQNCWIGFDKIENGFCEFSELRYGIRAFFLIIRSYMVYRKLRTPREIITRFAPPSENQTEHYIEYVCHDYMNPDEPITSYHVLAHLARKMAFYESATTLRDETIYYVLTYFHIFDNVLKSA